MKNCKGTPRRGRTGEYECAECGRCWDADEVPESHAAELEALGPFLRNNLGPTNSNSQAAQAAVARIAAKRPVFTKAQELSILEAMAKAPPVSIAIDHQQIGRAYRDLPMVSILDSVDRDVVPAVWDIDPTTRAWRCIDGPLANSTIQCRHWDFQVERDGVRERYRLRRHGQEGYVWSVRTCD